MKSQHQTIGDYVVISPVKDEERYFEQTIKALSKQTIRPAEWIIVDDGSCDRTPQIIEAACKEFDWIVHLRINRDAARKLGLAEIRAFDAGYKFASDHEYGFVVKLDGDVDLPHDYFEQMIARFQERDKLGIASGMYLEQRNDKWETTKMPLYHAAGAAKMVRTQCFKDIGGFPLFPGWDTADEIKAWAKGWETRHFPEIQFHHLKPEGSLQGPATHILHGEIYYVCGGGKGFFLFKVVERMMSGKPFLLGGVLLLYGYLRALVASRPKLVTPDEAELYRKLLNERIVTTIVKCFGPLNWKNGTRQTI
jgi:poly-beta-1,6-N-acetyl-D-glucosamine synthase